MLQSILCCPSVLPCVVRKSISKTACVHNPLDCASYAETSIPALAVMTCPDMWSVSRGLTMDLEDVSDFENGGDASERHDLVMQLASEGNYWTCLDECVFSAMQRLSFMLHLLVLLAWTAFAVCAT